jgi:hypothetical protein
MQTLYFHFFLALLIGVVAVTAADLELTANQMLPPLGEVELIA